MPQCPICNAAIWVGERHCATCGNYLPHPEEGDPFCPRCSIRVAPQQEICHMCKATLSGIADTPSPASAKGWRPILRGPGIFIGTGLVIVALLLAIRFTKSPGPPEQIVAPPPQIPADLKQNSYCPLSSPGRNRAISSYGSCGPGTRRSRTNRTSCSASDDANSSAVPLFCQRA